MNKQNSLNTWNKIVHSGLLKKSDTAILFYSFDDLNERLNDLNRYFSKFHALHTVAIKTNPHPEILKYIVSRGFGLEAASFEEVQLARNANAKPSTIVYNSPVKTKNEIEYCAKHLPQIQINANSIRELERINKSKSFENIGLRINPIVHPNDDDLYNVSGPDSKFGVPLHMRRKIIDSVLRYNVSTLHIHSGSRITDTSSAVTGIKMVFDLAEEINKLTSTNEKIGIRKINIGGGLPAGKTHSESENIMDQYVKDIQANIPNLKKKYSILTEFGQWIHKLNGVAYSTVEYVTHKENKCIIYIHLGADMFVRQAYTKSENYGFECLTKSGRPIKSKKILTDVTGPLCFNGDYLAKEVMIPALSEGDIVAIKDTGANTYGIWSRHCTRTIPKVVGLDSSSSNEIKLLSKRYNPFLLEDSAL